MVDLNKYAQESGYFVQEKPEDDRYEFTKGVTSALKNTVAGGKALVGAVINNDNMQLSAINDMRNNADENAGKVGRIEDINGVGDFTDWLSYNLGSGTASIATMVGSGGLGGLAVKGLAKGALVNATKGAAATAAGFTPNYGESLKNAYDATGEIKNQAAFASASIKTALDMIVPAKLMKAGIGKEATKNYSELAKQKMINDKGFTTWAKEMLNTGKTEAFTEGLQTYTDQVMVNVLTEADNPMAVRDSSEIFNAMASGAAGSMGFGVYGGVQRNRNAQTLRDGSIKTNDAVDDLWSMAQTDATVGKRVNQWQEKRSAVAKSGITDLVRQGITQEEATETVRLQLISSAKKQGMTDASAAASADDAISRQTISTMRGNDPTFFDQLDKQQVNYDVPTAARNSGATNDLEAGKYGEMLLSPAQESLRKMNSQTPADMVDEASNNEGFTPQDRAVLEGDVVPREQSQSLVPQRTYTGINGDFIEGEVTPEQAKFPTEQETNQRQSRDKANADFNSQPAQITDKNIVYGQDNTREIDGKIAQEKMVDGIKNQPKQITDKNIVFAEDANKPEKINIKANGKPFKNERLLKMSRGYKEAESNKQPVEIIEIEGGLGWRVKTVEQNKQESIEPTEAQKIDIKAIDQAEKEVDHNDPHLPLHVTVPEEENSDENNKANKSVKGKRAKVFTPNNSEIETEYQLIDVNDIVASNDITGAVNKQYPGELQPRDRSRAASQVQVQTMAKNIMPERLGESNETDRGAPIVKDGVVESGNGRTIALKEAYRTGGAEGYKQYLRANAAKFGLTIEQVDAIQQPILVRNRLTEMTNAERTAYTVDSNRSAGIEQGPSELAKSDASLLSDDDMKLLFIPESMDMMSSSNARFINKFAELLGRNESAKYLQANGEWNSQFGARLSNAIFAKGYNDPDLLASVSESTNQESKNLLHALMNVAGKISEIKGFDSHQGNVIGDTVAAAAQLVIKARRQNTSVTSLTSQTDLLSGGTKAEVETLAIMLDSNIRSAKRMSAILNDITQQIKIAAQNKDQADIFTGEVTPQPTIEEAINNVAHQGTKNQPKPTSTDLFSGSQSRAQEPEAANSVGTNAPKGTESSGSSGRLAAKAEKITDIGDKIGGARKDIAEKSDQPKAPKKKLTEGKQPYHKDFKVAEIAKDMKWPELEGKFSIQDARKGNLVKDRTNGISYDMKPLSFDTKEDAEQAALLAAVTKKHKVEYEYKHDENNKIVRDDKGNAVVEKYRIVRRVSDRKKVVIKDGFKSSYDAKKYLMENALEVYERKTNFGEEIIVTTDNPSREGKPHRKTDVTPAQFKDEFDFRGVEFGNWNNQEERQEVMNHAYDGLMDLADLLNVPPKALSLRGQLALAFGARGKGLSGAKAHYEMHYGVINLTKMSGSGSLAHEWLHALDHYLGRQAGNAEMEMTAKDIDGNPQFETGKNAEQNFLSVTHGRNPTIRAELLDAWSNVKQEAFTNVEESDEIHQDNIARQKRFIANYKKRATDELNSFTTRLSKEIDWKKRHNKAATPEQLARVKEITEELLANAKDLEFAYTPMSDLTGRSSWSQRHSNAQIDELAKIYKKVRGSYGFDTKDRRGVMDKIVNELSWYRNQLNKVEEVTKETTGKKITASRYLMNARDIDNGRVKDYWSTNYEMMARAFSSYIEDTVRDNGDKSEFLSYGSNNDMPQYRLLNVKPFPEGTERAKLNKAFDKLFAEIKVKETDQGTVLFSRSVVSDGTAVGVSDTATVSQADTDVVIDSIVSGWDGGSLRKQDFVVVSTFDELPQVIKDAAKDQDAEDGVGGVFHKGKTYLVRDKLANAQDVEATIFHETYGHHGIRKLFGKDIEQKLNQLLVGIGGINGLDRIAKKYGVDLNAYKKGLAGSSLTNAQAQTILMDELLAHLAQSNKPSIMRKVKEIIGAIRQWLKKSGFVNLHNTSDSELFYILKQARSAVKGNTGKNTNSDIRFSRVSDIKDKLTPKKLSDSLIANEDEGKINTLIRHIQDKFRPLKTVQKIIEKSGRTISDAANAYVAEELFHGKAEEDLRKMKRDHVQPLVDALTKHKIDMAELDLYLIAKHAKERNAYVSSKNDAFDGESGSGMTNDEAQAILDRVNSEGKTQALDEVAKKVYAMTAARREVLNKNGLLSDGELDSWESSYEFYVPLKGFAQDERDSDNKSIPRVGKGFAISGNESIRALGRRTMAASPSTQVIQDLTESILRHRKNEVGNAFLKLVQSNPDHEFWQVFTDKNPEIDRRYNKQSGRVEETKLPMAMLSDRYFTTKVDGETYYIKIADERLMNAMKNLGVDKVNGVVQTLGTINRYLSTINTSLNPEFVISNMARDIQTAVFNVLAEQDLPQGKIKGKDIASNMIKDWAAARKGIALSLAGKPQAEGKAGEYQQLFDQFREDGAKTGYFDMKDIDQQVSDLNNMLEMAGDSKKGMALRAKKTVGDFVENINQSVENAVRLSAYKQALDAGVSRQKAASLAKNLTVNFNRKGEVGTTMNALYMFANASVQGTAQFLRSMQGYRDQDGNYKFTGAQKVAAGFAVGAMVLAALNRAFSDEDDDGVSFWDKVPDHIKERNIVVMKSVFGVGEPGEYYSIPLPYGYNIFSVFGTSVESIFQGEKTVAQASGNMVGALIGSFSPIGAQDSDSVINGVVKSISPTILSPFVQLTANENFYGGKIYRENYQFGTQKPDSSLAKRGTHNAYKAISSWLNEATGGSYYQSGIIDINPEIFAHLIDFGTGAAGTFATRSVNAAAKAVSGEKLESREIPFYRKLNGETNDDWGDQDKFYERSNKIKQVVDEYSSLKGNERIEFKRNNESLIMLTNHVKVTEKQLRELRKRYKLIEANESLSITAKSKQLDMNRKQQDRLVDKFNERYSAINK